MENVKNGNEIAQRPGIVVYFETFRAMRFLTSEETQELVRMMWQYAEYGVEPESPMSKCVGALWETVKSRIDHDNKRYRQKSASRKKSKLGNKEKEQKQDIDEIVTEPASKNEKASDDISQKFDEVLNYFENAGFSLKSAEKVEVFQELQNGVEPIEFACAIEETQQKKSIAHPFAFTLQIVRNWQKDERIDYQTHNNFTKKTKKRQPISDIYIPPDVRKELEAQEKNV